MGFNKEPQNTGLPKQTLKDQQQSTELKLHNAMM